MTHHFTRLTCMIQAKERLQQIARPTSPYIPLVQRLAKALARGLPEQSSPAEFVVRATLAADRVYTSFTGQARTKLLAEHVSLLAQTTCTPEFAAKVHTLYTTSGGSP